VDRLTALDVAPETIRAAAAHGRAALFELFRILGSAETEAQRSAAGQALAAIWSHDDLIPEEEKALVRRGYAVTWRARRRYPRALQAPIPISVAYGVPFLAATGDGIAPERLEWSHRVVGARRADLEHYAPWTAANGRAQFTLIPGDFESNGPHHLALEARVRTAGLTDAWELDLPHMRFSFEFDSRLAVEAILALPDDARAEVMARAVRLEREESEAAVLVNLNDGFALRNPPVLTVLGALPCDLAHTLEVELEDMPGRLAAGAVVVLGQGTNPRALRFPLDLAQSLAPAAIERPGTRRLRAILTADPHRGWAEPDVRSLWPGVVTTEWVEAEVVRR
jgi:hypothetical protein